MNIKKIIVFVSFYSVYLPYLAFGTLPQNVLEDIQREIAELIEIAKPSVVTISSKSSHSYIIPKDNGLLSFFRDNREERTVFYNSICSGLIYNKDGYIITKSNGINEFEDTNVILSDGTQYKPKYIGQDQETGITVLKIDAENLYPCKIGNSEKVSIGSWVTIIGNSMGISPSISFGLVNGILKNGIFQFSAIVSPGNSGSPVFSIDGKVIGILAAQVEVVKKMAATHEQSLFTEAGLALPINKTCIIVEEIIKSYKEQVGWIGIQLKPDSLKLNNLKITNVIHNSPAEKAGLKRGDILTKYNNTSLINSSQLGELIKNTSPGATVPISFIRYGARLNVFVTVGIKRPFLGRRLQTMRTEYIGYYLKTFQSMNQDTSPGSVSKLQNKVRRLEQEIFQLKTILKKEK